MPATNRNLGFVILDLIESSQRTFATRPLNLGGLPGAAGGEGAPPGGYIGWLPQTRVAYDYDEIASSGIPASGVSLLDNLNHIRYRLNILESGGSITVVDSNTPATYYDTTTLHFSGAGVTVTDLGGGNVLVEVNAAGSGGAALTVEEADGSPSVTSVDKIIFSGATVQDMGGGDVLVTFDGQDNPPYNLSLFLYATDSDVSTYDTLSSEIKSDGASATASSITTDTLIKAFVANPNQLNFLPKQRAQAHMFFEKIGGSKDVQGYVQLYHRTSGGTETLLGTSDYTDILTGDLTGYYLDVNIDNKTFSSTDRLVLKVYGHPSGSGTDPSVVVSYGTESFGYQMGRISLGANRDSFLVIEELDGVPSVQNVDKIIFSGFQVQDMGGGDAMVSPDSTVVFSSDYSTGWISATEAWTRTGNHTFTVTGDLTSKFRVGTKIRYKDGGSYEYGIVKSSSHSSGTTTVTLMTNIDYTMAAATITDRYVSYIALPEGFPVELSVALSFTNLTLGSGTEQSRVHIAGGLCHVRSHIIFNSTTVGGSITIATPMNTNSLIGSTIRDPIGIATYLDASPLGTTLGNVVISTTNTLLLQVVNASATYATVGGLSSTIPFTWANSDELSFFAVFPIF